MLTIEEIDDLLSDWYCQHGHYFAVLVMVFYVVFG